MLRRKALKHIKGLRVYMQESYALFIASFNLFFITFVNKNRKSNYMRKYLLLLLILTGAAQDIAAQSGIYACGHFRRNRPTTVRNIKNSGYTNVILFNIDIQSDGTLTTDYDWAKKAKAEAGGIICQNGVYTFASYQPYFANDVKSLLREPTSVERIEICIGGWGNGSYGNLKTYIAQYGTGPTTTLYKNFQALKKAIPEITAVNNDQEQDYDEPTALKFHTMLYDLGYKTTIAPYMNRSYWVKLVDDLNKARKGCVDWVYLQTYGGGSGNNPADWNFGDIPMWVGFDCESSSDIDAMERNFKNWKASSKASGGFLWNYNSESRDLNQWASAINRIFSSRKVDPSKLGAKAYSETAFGGYCVELEEGKYYMADLAALGLKATDLSSLEVTNGYKVTIYRSTNPSGVGKSFTESASTMPTGWDNSTRAIKVENLLTGIDKVRLDNNIQKDGPTYNTAGQRVNAKEKGVIIRNGKAYLNQ